MSALAVAERESATAAQFVTFRIGGQLFGTPILGVHEVFELERVARVPLAPPEIDGVLNLRGRIVTTIAMRSLLGFPPRATTAERSLAIGVEFKGEFYGLVIDEVGEVMALDGARSEPVPANLDRRWAETVAGVFRLDGELMLIIDIERALGRVSAQNGL